MLPEPEKSDPSISLGKTASSVSLASPANTFMQEPPFRHGLYVHGRTVVLVPVMVVVLPVVVDSVVVVPVIDVVVVVPVPVVVLAVVVVVLVMVVVTVVDVEVPSVLGFGLVF